MVREPSGIVMALFDQIVCISLSSRSDRRLSITQQIQNSKALRDKPFEFFDALYWKHVEDQGAPKGFAAYEDWENQNIERSFWNRPLSPAEIACAVSHFRVWEQAAERKNCTLVLEDDAVFTESFEEIFPRVEEEMRGVKFDLLYLGRNDWAKEPENFTKTVCKPSYSEDAHAYIISPEFAGRLLDDSFRGNLIPVDSYLALTYSDFYFQEDKPFDRNTFCVRSDKVYAVEPSIVLQQRDLDKPDSTAFSDLIDCVNQVWSMWHPINKN
jgi:GR25 family glycosyltransferase involved in LPS biosynthesis